MELTEFQFSNVFVRLIIWSIFLFLLFRAIKFIYPYFIRKKRPRQKITIVLLLTETCTWIIFLASFIWSYSRINNAFIIIILAVLLILIFWISRFWIKDILAGVVFRSSSRFEIGDIIQVGDFKGIIRSFRNYTVELEGKDGTLIFIPYSKVIELPQLKSESMEKQSGYTFTLHCNPDIETEELIRQIKNSIITLPWISVTKKPAITLLKQSDSLLEFEITVYPIDRSQQAKIEKYLKDKYEKIKS